MASVETLDRRWVRRSLAIVVALLLIGGTSSAYLRRGPQEVTVDQALAQFRESSTEASQTGGEPTPDGQQPPEGAPDAGAPATTAAPSSAAPAGKAAAPGATAAPADASGATQTKPQPGVYTYETKGYESTDAVGGARHDYPAETAMTVHMTPCGWMARWQPLQERWEESDGCNEPAGFGLRRFTMYHEFFQRGVREDFTCPPGSTVNPVDSTPGRTWSFECKSEGSVMNMTARVIGYEYPAVDGRGVHVVHIRYEGRMSGANRGVQIQERWQERGSGLAVRITTSVDADVSSPFGFVHYEEKYEINLKSMTPRR